MSTLEHAIAIAAFAHADQIDKAGEPYIFHPLRVMMKMITTDEQIAAVLHDVVEDTPVTLKDLEREGFKKKVLRGVEHVTKREGEDYFDFVRRAAKDPIGRAIKRADLEDNSNMTRLNSVTEKDKKRLAKYQKALAMLDEIESQFPRPQTQ